MRCCLVNKTPSFLVPNCIGGILFHDLNLQFRSPTVNTMMTQTDFVKFVRNLDAYLEMNLEFYRDPDFTCPCARLGDITIHFTHYHTAEEAEQKWTERARRIDRENLFIFCEERDGLTEAEIRSLATVKARGILVFTANKCDDIPYALQIPKYQPDGEVGNILARNYLDDSREYERYFDFVKWFNEADGNDFAIQPFIR